MSILLKEDGLETIRARSLERVHLIQRLSDCFSSYLLNKGLTRLIIENMGLGKIIQLVLDISVMRVEKVRKVYLSFFP
jgi:hypothetical protein